MSSSTFMIFGVNQAVVLCGNDIIYNTYLVWANAKFHASFHSWFHDALINCIVTYVWNVLHGVSLFCSQLTARFKIPFAKQNAISWTKLSHWINIRNTKRPHEIASGDPVGQMEWYRPIKISIWKKKCTKTSKSQKLSAPLKYEDVVFESHIGNKPQIVEIKITQVGLKYAPKYVL